MSNRRQAQIRQERKRRRREERRKRGQQLARPVRSARRVSQDEWSQSMILTPAGRLPDPKQVARFAALGTMSDALLRLMEPYIRWPPHSSEVEDLEGWLELGAAVWNATLDAATSVQLQERLRGIVDEWELSGEEDPIALVDGIAMRKLRYYAQDYRHVETVHVKAEGGQATVQAVTTAYLR
jgi:hypothetical protein